MWELTLLVLGEVLFENPKGFSKGVFSQKRSRFSLQSLSREAVKKENKVRV